MKQKFNPLKHLTPFSNITSIAYNINKPRPVNASTPCASPRFSSIRCSIVDEAGLVELMSLSAEHRGSLHPAPGYLAFSEQAIKV